MVLCNSNIVNDLLFTVYLKSSLSDYQSVYGTIGMPKYILCDENEVLKIRKTRKVLQTPTFPKNSTEYKYSKTLLYYPIARNTEIDIERIDDYYYAKEPNGQKDYNGKALTIIETNER